MCIFRKRYMRSVQWNLGQSPRSRVIFENFCFESNLRVCKVTFNCKLRKKMGQQDVLIASPIILFGEQLLPMLSRFPRLCLLAGFYGNTRLTWVLIFTLWTLECRRSSTTRVTRDSHCTAPAIIRCTSPVNWPSSSLLKLWVYSLTRRSSPTCSRW